MATYNIGLTGQTNSNVPWIGNNRVGVLSYTIDLSQRGYLCPAAGFASGDVLQLADIPVGCYYMGGALNVKTVEGSAGTVALATTGTAITLLAATSINSAAATVFTGAAGLITTAAVLQATLGGTLTYKVAVFSVSLIIADCR
jgi:hypothetical protein